MGISSWRTIFNKRENFRAAFDNFQIENLAHFSEKDVKRLLLDAGIIRHRGKIEAVINNAARVQELIVEEGSFAAYVWRYEPDPDSIGPPQSQSTSPDSIALSKDLKNRGWRFVGPTTVYAFLQSMGLINDQLVGCVTRAEVTRAREVFTRPE